MTRDFETEKATEQIECKSKSIKKLSCIKVFWIFMLGSVIGFIFEGVLALVKRGRWEHHSATVWGPFCIIYGLGAVAVCLLSQALKDKHIIIQFFAFALSGMAVEYFGSLFQEICFGSTSWDYSSHFMNIEGRVSLGMALVWGVFGIIFMKFIYTHIMVLLDLMHGRLFKIFSIYACIIMIINLVMSASAIMRWRARLESKPASNQIEEYLDSAYNDDTMERLFPNMVFHDQN